MINFIVRNSGGCRTYYNVPTIFLNILDGLILFDLGFIRRYKLFLFVPPNCNHIHVKMYSVTRDIPGAFGSIIKV